MGFNTTSFPSRGSFSLGHTLDVQSSIRELLKQFLCKARLRFEGRASSLIEGCERERVVSEPNSTLAGRPFFLLNPGKRTEHPAVRRSSRSIEQHLGEPIEIAIGRHTGVQVEPSSVAQIGQVSGVDPMNALAVAPAFFEKLEKEGYTWVVFPSRNHLRLAFGRLHIISADSAAFGVAPATSGEHTEYQRVQFSRGATVFAARLRDAWSQA